MPTTTTDPNINDAQQAPTDRATLTLAPPKPKPLAPAASQQAPGQAPQLSLAAAPAPSIPSPTVQAPAQPVDRVALATQAYDTFAKAQEPAYQKSLESVTGQAAGLGQLGSGQWRSALTNEANTHQLALDTARDSLINKATEGSIADASTAYQQALASSQQGLATELGRGNLDIAHQNADTSKTGTLGQLDLARKGQEQSGEQFNQSLDFQKAQADIEAQFKSGALTLAQRDQALKELTNQQQFGLAGQSLDFQKAQAAIENQFKAGTLTLAQKDQALRELQNSQQLELAKGSLAEQTAARLQQSAQFDKSLQQSAEQFKASLAQNAQQFGLSQDQTMALAKLSDATANRSIDASTAQGKNALLLELAKILGGPTGNVNPAIMAQIAKGFGIVIPTSGLTGGGVGGTGGTGGTGGGSGGGSGGGGSGGKV